MGKQRLKVNKKFYIVDLGLRNHILPRRNYDFGFTLENVVYFELLRRGYQVMITSLNEALSAGMALSAVSRIFAFALRHGKAQ